MRKTGLAIFAAALLFAVACDTPKKEALDACGCAQAQVKGNTAEDVSKQCDESRKANQQFEADFQKCLLAARAGVDSSQISVNKMDAEKGLNLPAAGDGTYSFSVGESSVKWIGTKMTGKHNGTIRIKSGTIELSNGNITGGEMVIDMTTIRVEDLSGDSKADLEAHLGSDDFFSVAHHKESVFVFKSAKAVNKHEFEVTGDLTIKGITKPLISKILVIPTGGNMVKVNGGLAIDRTDYDIKFRSGKFFQDLGDKIIYDEFVITLDLKAVK